MSRTHRLPVHIFASTLLVAIIMLGGYIAWSHAESSAVNIHHATINPTVTGMSATGAFMMIENTSDKDIALVGAKSDVAPHVEIHEHTMKDGLMSMQAVDEIVIPAGQTITLQPGGYHVMMMGLTQALRRGRDVKLTLEFNDGSEVAVKAKVQKAGAHHHSHY